MAITFNRFLLNVYFHVYLCVLPRDWPTKLTIYEPSVLRIILATEAALLLKKYINK